MLLVSSLGFDERIRTPTDRKGTKVAPQRKVKRDEKATTKRATVS
jgi:hypothetical protein